jgi:hypothetical protein
MNGQATRFELGPAWRLDSTVALAAKLPFFAAAAGIAALIGTLLVQDTALAAPYSWATRALLVGLWLTGLGLALRLVVQASSTALRIAVSLAFALILAALAALDALCWLLLDFVMFWQA